MLIVKCMTSIIIIYNISFRREKVKRMFYHAYNGYLQYAYPYDELMPLTCSGMDTWGSFSLTLVDALDTLIVMGNFTEFERASKLVLENVNVDANVNVSVFETNIRVVGGLLSAHMLSGLTGIELEDGWPCHGPLLRLAERMAYKLLPAFNSKTGMPYGTVNLKYGLHKLETPVTCTAGVGTFLIEFASLSRLTGNHIFERVSNKAMEQLYKHRSSIGLLGNHINVETGIWTATDAGIGAGVDSYYEYLVKAAVLFDRPELMRQFKEQRKSIEKYMEKGDWFPWVSMAQGQVTMPVFQSLEAFWPGVLTLVGDVDKAYRIMMNYYQIVKQYGFIPEFYNIYNSEAMQKRSGYPLRPEFIESLMYLYRATKDPLLLEIGAELVDVIEEQSKTKCGYATVQDVRDHILEDRMESFFLAETTKYLYLLFDEENFIHNPGLRGHIIDTPNGACIINSGGYIFNTEAHPVDPSILYCCDKRRQRDQLILNDFHNNIDLIGIL
uniref:alpha-1,2-Mannosidase n=1 Tax=Romanomermis culicivorax TaxID=13658 RepID=A0A915J4M6_ROMCU